MALAALPTLAFAAGNNWMASKSNLLLVSQLSIPGTHDSGALYEPVSGTAKCQNLSIADQLNAGVRFLDIRCRHINDAFAIHHGSIYQNANFNDVLNAVIGFLNSNPSETVIMSVKEEHTPSGNTRSFEQTFDTYVAANPSKWLLSSSIPKLSDARGKIVLFRRFGAGSLPKGIDASNWPDNTTFTSGNLRVQDVYNVSSNNTKWTNITNLFNESNTRAHDTLFVNFTSGVASIIGIPNIPTVSNDINGRLSTYLTNNPNRRYGVVVMDFADSAKCNLIINNGTALYHDSAFMLVNKATGKVVDLIGGNTANGATVNQWSYDYNGPNQRWALMPTEGSNHFALVSFVSNKAAGPASNSTADGAQLTSSDYTANNAAQQWDLVDAGNGWYKIRNVNSGKVLDVDAGSTADNAKIQQWADLGGDNQLWRLQPWGDYFSRAASGRYICVEGASGANGANIIQYDWENNPWFKWRFESVGDGNYKLSSLNALTRVLCVKNGSTAQGFDCHLWDYSATNVGDQKLRILPLTNGKFRFNFVHTGFGWDIPGGATGNNVHLQQYPYLGNAWQQFTLERVR